MIFDQTSLPGVIRVIPRIYSDNRGFFMETRQSRVFAEHGIDANFVQDNFSQSTRGTVRGIHYQIEQQQGKLIRVVKGEIYDVAVDLRKSSPHFGEWFGTRLSEENRHLLWVPPGFGHGFLVVSEVAQVDYKCTDYYSPEHERSIRWNDPDIGIEWPLGNDEQPVLSDKDVAAPLLNNAETYE